ncbi:MAG: chromate transporter, partial [Oscillospiraceae bacterium]|nr:chromate transporter [Oscillospiraceae bacterium]
MEILTLYLAFLKIGLFTIGGGLAMLPLMQRELVEGGLMTLAETADMVAISQMTPGPFAVNAATFAGMKLYGLPGAAAATLGVVTPSVVITALVAKFFIAFSKRQGVRDTMGFIRPVVTGLIL